MWVGFIDRFSVYSVWCLVFRVWWDSWKRGKQRGRSSRFRISPVHQATSARASRGSGSIAFYGVGDSLSESRHIRSERPAVREDSTLWDEAEEPASGLLQIHVLCIILCLIRSLYMDNGVDLNRNFPVCFAIDKEGSSPDVCSEIYRVPTTSHWNTGTEAPFRARNPGHPRLSSPSSLPAHVGSVSPRVRTVCPSSLLVPIPRFHAQFHNASLVQTRHSIDSFEHSTQIHHRTGVGNPGFVLGERWRSGLFVPCSLHSIVQCGVAARLSTQKRVFIVLAASPRPRSRSELAFVERVETFRLWSCYRE